MYQEQIGQILLRQTALTEPQLARALSLQKEERPRRLIGEFLVEQGLIQPRELARALADQWELGFLPSIAKDQLDAALVKELPLEFLKKQGVVPIVAEGGGTAMAMADPRNVHAYDAVANVLGEPCRRVITTAAEIEQAISSCYYEDSPATGGANESAAERTASETSEALSGATQPEDLLNVANKAPIIKLVNTIFFDALRARASDIHIEPYEDIIRVRFRIDGVLHDVLTPPKHQGSALISRLKIMGNLNIAERRLPQDGQTRIKTGHKHTDVRISTIPTGAGERVVLRLLDKESHNLSLAQLGFEPDVRQSFKDLIHTAHGVILLTGPTGSGKTTTLYAAINELNSEERNILTVEDPIEYQLAGIGQMQIKPKIGLTFANCLRHLLRQDPDVIMIGEIRDRETAQIAVQASLTGHLVLSTLHTNDSASAVTRLVDMEVEPYLLSSSLLAVMAQRLVRIICRRCKRPCRLDEIPDDLRPTTAGKEAFEGQFCEADGCKDCLNTGYYGRTGIFELLVVDEQIKELINKRSATHVINEAALSKGMRPLREDGLSKARAGETTLEEVLRVTQNPKTTTAEAKEHVGI